MPGYIIKQLGCLRLSARTVRRFKDFILVMLVTGGCLGLLGGPAGAAPPSPRLLVAATILPLGDFCQKIGGDLVKVQVLIPPGASPEGYEPSPSDMASAYQARVFVYVGPDLEAWGPRFLRARGTKDLVVVEATRGVPLMKMTEAGRLTGNPHIWLDPVLAQEICRKIAAAFIQADPSHRAQYEANLQHYLAALAALHLEIENHAKSWRLREYVAFHPDLAYFARRYGLHCVGIIEESAGREPTPRYLRNLVAAIKHAGVKAIFAEPQLNSRVVHAIAQEAGAKVLPLDPLGGRPPYGNDYIKLMHYNLATLDQALK